MARAPNHRRDRTPRRSDPIDNSAPTPLGRPVFAQPAPTADPTKFVVHHPSDDPVDKQIDELNHEHKLAPLPFPLPRDLPEPQLTLAAVLGTDGNAAVQRIAQ